MKRREFIAGIGGATIWPLAVRAQTPDQMKRVGVLMGISENTYPKTLLAAFQASRPLQPI